MNRQIIEAFVAKLSRRIEWRIADFGETYAQAKEYIQKESVAGPAVWAELDALFAGR